MRSTHIVASHAKLPHVIWSQQHPTQPNIRIHMARNNRFYDRYETSPKLKGIGRALKRVVAEIDELLNEETE